CIGPRSVALIGRDLDHSEVLGSSFKHRGQQGGIVCIATPNLYRSHDIGFHAAHQMALNPIVLYSLFSVFHVKPTEEAGSSEARGIHGELYLDRLERQTALGYEALEQGRQFWFFEGIRDAVEMWDL